VKQESGSQAKQRNFMGKELYLDDSDFVDCIDGTKLHLLAKGCICPGLITLISNLSSSEIESRVTWNSWRSASASVVFKRRNPRADVLSTWMQLVETCIIKYG
jgi:hypothetical protein